MQRFFSQSSLEETRIIQDSNPLFRQVVRVLRMKQGEKAAFFEAEGDDIIYTLHVIEKRRLVFQRDIHQKEKFPKQTYPGITVFQAIPHAIGIVDLLVRKLTELGTQELVLFRADRSQYDSSRLRCDRLAKIAQEAMEQCGSNHPMKITLCQNKEILYQNYGTYLHIVGSLEGGGYNGKEILAQNQGNVGFWIGPEGGWTKEEIHFFSEKKCIFWQFSPHILRLETASIVGTGILRYLLSKKR